MTMGPMQPTTHERPEFQFRLRTIFAAMTVLAIIFASCGALVSSCRAMTTAGTGPVPSSDDWPRPLKELVADEGVELDESSIQVYCMYRLESEFVWETDAVPGLMEHLMHRWKLTQISRPDWPILKGHSHFSGVATPAWWTPKDDGFTDFFVNPSELTRDMSDRLQVAHDKKRKKIFVRYWFNF
jgi:hypothetical protein